MVRCPLAFFLSEARAQRGRSRRISCRRSGVSIESRQADGDHSTSFASLTPLMKIGLGCVLFALMKLVVRVAHAVYGPSERELRS